MRNQRLIGRALAPPRPALCTLAAALAMAAASASAQTPDSTAVPEAPVSAAPADSLRPGIPDSLNTGRLPRPAVAPFGPAAGRPVTPVPATTAALSPEALLAETPGAFGYRLGAPGRVGGVSLDALGPEAPALTLDGRPLGDLFTDAPRTDLLPYAATGPIRRDDGRLGRAIGLSAGLRPFRLAVPVTELRYGGGQDGIQYVSATHAQTRRPPAFLRGGSAESRLTLTGHVASRAAAAPLAGGRLRHLDALGRLLLTRPGAAVEAGVLHADRRVGARDGVTAPTFDDLFDLDAAAVVRPNATRRTLRTEAWARARLALAADPLEVGASYAVQRLVYTPGGADTTRVHGRRLAGFVRQPVGLGGHALGLRLDAIYEPAPDLGLGPLSEAGARTHLHAAVTDSLRLGPLAIAAAAGLNRVGDEAWPSATLRAETGPLFAGVRYGGRARSRVEAAGLAGRIAPDATTAGERTLAAEVGVEVHAGPWRLAARAFGHVQTDLRVLVAQGDSAFAFGTVPDAVRQGGVAGALGWRETARRGLYLRAEGTTRALLDPGTSEIHARLDAALPRVWGTLRLGLRAEDVGDGVLDLDLAAVGAGWTAFRSRWTEPATGLLALPDPGSAFGIEIPAQATLGLEATATFSAQASLFLRYDHALGERLTSGALVTQGEPLAPHVLRFGVFWALLN